MQASIAEQSIGPRHATQLFVDGSHNDSGPVHGFSASHAGRHSPAEQVSPP
jgi:hypothetical protein